ncbi:Similar to hypothetical protein FG05753.1 [Gibberella zeae PH-1]; acc. no. XP_385929 [Pyronema omphalodes CBS 100304]|uniref:Uncharacterized protein n=1 Tax=Pyronema omphalodes (strain CBS 100304) TaxID=1076935 RepID=U4KXE7_PYROM|nr:Similar to hypothetical protein FG05753.1 [Gibberella zeae PH-1]; acc. no. XP_385929 [Pyronema omphalodes CBS 100304]
MVAFYDDKCGQTFTPNVLKPGYTMAFLYPEFHYFADGQTGIRIEQSDIDQGSVKILPYTMDTLLKANDQIWKKKDSSECQKCQKSLRRRSVLDALRPCTAARIVKLRIGMSTRSSARFSLRSSGLPIRIGFLDLSRISDSS